MGTCRWSNYFVFKQKITIKQYYTTIIKLWFRDSKKNIKQNFYIFNQFIFVISQYNFKENIKRFFNYSRFLITSKFFLLITNMFSQIYLKLPNYFIKKLGSLIYKKFKIVINKHIKFIFLVLYTFTSIGVFWILFDNNVIYYKFFYKLFFIFLLGFFLFSTFIHLNKQYQYNKYTSQIQRFWKRTYMIFWFVELNLFFLFIYLLMIHFSESPYFLDWKNLQSIWLDSILNIVFFIFFFNIIIITSYLIFFFFKLNLVTYIAIGLYIIFFSLYVLCFYEFSKFFYILNFFQDSDIQLFISNQLMQNIEIDQNLKFRTLNFYIYLFNILKFWHVIFILLCFIFFLNNYLFQKRFSIDLWSMNFQNFLFLYIFNLLSFWYILKQYCILLGQNVYFWFYTTQNKLSFYYNFFYEVLLICSCSIK